MARPAWDTFGKPYDPLSEENLRKENRQQLLADILRNAGGMGEAALTMGTSLADMAGTGLGTLAGMAKQRLSGEKPDLDAATETLQEGKFTYRPRTEGGQEALRGLETVTAPIEQGMQWAGQKTADVTGSPAAGAAVYTGLNVLDPQLLAPGAAKVAALRGAQNVARSAADTAVPMGEALKNVPVGQRGAYTLEDLASVEGDFELQSPTLLAFGKLKKQEQRVPGRQMLKALQREGAKPDELKWAGLDKLLDTDEVVDAAEVRAIAEGNVPQLGWETKGGRPDPIEMPKDQPPVPRWQNPYEGMTPLEDAMEVNDDLAETVNDWIRERTYEDSDLEYPTTYMVVRGSGRNRDVVDTFDNERDAERFIEREKEDLIESETQYYLDNIDEHFDEDQLAEMDDDARQSWAEEAARQSVEDNDELRIDSEIDYDAEPENLESIEEYWREQAMENAADFGDYAPSAAIQRQEERRWYRNQGIDPDTLSWLQDRPRRETPSYGEYTVGGNREEGRDVLGGAGQNYGVTLANVLREGRFGRGQDVQQIMGDLQTSGTPLASREAARITEREGLPDIEAARGEFTRRGTHYGENILHVRETDRPAPSWGTTQVDAYGNPNPMRLVEEVQSDPYQRGRKIGFLDPEKVSQLRMDEAERVNSFRREALGTLPMVLREPAVDEFIQAIRNKPEGSRMPAEQRIIEMADKLGQGTLDEQFDTADELFRELYYSAPAASTLESRANEVRNSLGQLPSMDASPFDKMIPEGPFMETDQYTKLGVIDALRRAVKQGQQYVAFTPGEVHARRYGSESIQWAPHPDKPDTRVITGLQYGTSGRGPIDERVRQLQQNPFSANIQNRVGEIDLNSPDADSQLKRVVEAELDYGMHEYPQPGEQRAKRAQMLAKMLREKPSGDYTPREFGFADVYDRRVKKALTQALREAGSKAQIREIEGEFGIPTFESLNQMTGERTFETPTNKNRFDELMRQSQENPDLMKYHPPKLYAIEIDPELARAAKRGFKLPY